MFQFLLYPIMQKNYLNGDSILMASLKGRHVVVRHLDSKVGFPRTGIWRGMSEKSKG